MPQIQGETRDIALAVSVDAVNQFQVEINGEKAEYQGQGFHNYVVKSGGSQFHGSLFEYFRNTALDAKNYFVSFVPPDHQNEYGGNIGGPIKKDRLFFFVNYDAYDFNTTSAPTVLTIPTRWSGPAISASCLPSFMIQRHRVAAEQSARSAPIPLPVLLILRLLLRPLIRFIT